MKLMRMIGIQHMGDTNTTLPEIPDWFLKISESGWLWIIFIIEILVMVGVVIGCCRQYYELKEIDNFLKRQKREAKPPANKRKEDSKKRRDAIYKEIN